MALAFRRRSAVAAVLVALVAAGAPRASAQATDTPAASNDRIDQLERRLTDLERQHQRDLEARDKEIAELRRQLATRPATGATAPTENVEKTKQDILKDIESHNESRITLRTPANFNPDLAVVVDMVGSWSSHRENDALNRFDVREAELDLRAAVDPRADGVVVLAFERDTENPIFPGAGDGGEEGAGPNTGTSVEEAYLLLHDFGVPNLTARVGRFHVRFGRQNILHLHDLPTTDPPFVNQAFLAPEALSDAGLSLSYVIPPERVGNQYIELIAEILAGEGGDSESPVFTGDASVDSPAYNLHALWNHDLSHAWNVELGGSWMHGHRSNDNAIDADLFGGDLTLIHTDPTGGFRNMLLQAEVMYGLIDTEDTGRQESWGAYVLGQQQLNRDWYAGLRLDWTEDPNNDNQEAWGVTPYVSWYWSEFLRFRLSYQHRDGDRPADDAVYLQLTWIFGAHPPHPYWAMR